MLRLDTRLLPTGLLSNSYPAALPVLTFESCKSPGQFTVYAASLSVRTDRQHSVKGTWKAIPAFRGREPHILDGVYCPGSPPIHSWIRNKPRKPYPGICCPPSAPFMQCWIAMTTPFAVRTDSQSGGCDGAFLLSVSNLATPSRIVATNAWRWDSSKKATKPAAEKSLVQ